MRNIGWLRYALASMVLVGSVLGTTVAACGDNDAATSVDDAGNDIATTGDGSVVDGSDDPNATVTPAKLTIVNAATNFGPNTAIVPTGHAGIRLCFKQGTTDANVDYAPFPPLPDKPPALGSQLPPALYIGTGEAFPNFGIDLSNRILVPILMNPLKLKASGIVNPGNGQPGPTCDQILKGNSEAGALQPNVDYWELPKIEAGTFLRDRSYLVVLTGCVSNTPFNVDSCGQDPTTDAAAEYRPTGIPGIGNLKITITELTRTPVSASGLGIQVAHLAVTAVPDFRFWVEQLEPGFVASPPVYDSGTFVPATGGPVSYMQVTSAQTVMGVNDTQYFVSNKLGTYPFLTPLLPISLPDVQRATFGDAAVPTIYSAGKNFVFIAYGAPLVPAYRHFGTGQIANADDPDAIFNPYSYHYLAFPTDPEVSKYKP